MKKILLDTDIGGDIDDAICLAYLLREPNCELLGITTVCGESEKRASVADAICKAAGRKIPVIAGRDLPLQPIPVYPTPDGADALERWPHNSFVQEDAAAFLYKTIRENPHEVSLIAIGNLTNAALLFQTYPDAAGLLKGFYCMNGYFGTAPLPEPWYNWNAWADPLAAKIVYDTPVAIHRTVSLEVTETLTAPAADAAELLPAEDDLMRAVYDLGGAWLRDTEQLTLHDPLAAVSVFHRELCTWARGGITVETEDETHMGATGFTPDPAGYVEIARNADRTRFYQILSETLKKRA